VIWFSAAAVSTSNCLLLSSCSTQPAINKSARAGATAWGGPFANLFWRALPRAHPTWSNHAPGVITWAHVGWSLNRQNHPERPLWPREIISRPRRQHRSPVGGPSPQSRAEGQGIAPLGKGVNPQCRAGNCRGLESPGGLCPAGRSNPPLSSEFELVAAWPRDFFVSPCTCT
jgi:hypothetical protein